MQIRLKQNRREVVIAARVYECEDLVSSPHATVVMLLHMAIIAWAAGRHFIDTELFTESEIVSLLGERNERPLTCSIC